ncbi:T9SS type A sorting domain-containing protein [Empedobacter sp.]|uniref:T9SS type A sorting domain-containing protein n=1 Tax=Empedobacter sp. TaxID=1927715 RepID=UPI0028AA9286|nr:T9SS type A sorting domain-containing protein [Empedobacter sp.]
MFDDKLKSVIETKKGFLLVGNSNSPISGNKTIDQTSNGTWIVQITQKGEIISEQNLNLNSENQLISFQENENGYLFSILEKAENKLKPKVIQTDFNFQTQKTTELEIDSDLAITEIKLIDNKFLFTANKISTLEQLKSNNHSIESYYITQSFDENGSKIWNKQFGEEGFNYLEKAITTRDGSLILFGNSTQQAKGNKGQSDFYLVKLGKETDDIKRVYIEAYPNPTQDVVNVLINKDFKKASVDVYNLIGQHLQSKDVKYRSTPISLGNYPSGVYILKINHDNQTESIKIIKK